jgi:hypothetical protein
MVGQMDLKENPERISFIIGLIFAIVSMPFIGTAFDIFIIFISITFIFWGYSLYRLEMESEPDIGDFTISTIFLLIFYIITLLFIILSIRFGEISWSAILFLISLWIMYILFYYPQYMSYKESKKANRLTMRMIIKEYKDVIPIFVIFLLLPCLMIISEIFSFDDIIFICLIIAWMVLFTLYYSLQKKNRKK